MAKIFIPNFIPRDLKQTAVTLSSKREQVISHPTIITGNVTNSEKVNSQKRYITANYVKPAGLGNQVNPNKVEGSINLEGAKW